MLFHVTVTHRADQCPGSRPDALPALVSDDAAPVRPRLVLWSASCLLFAKREHVAYALVEAGTLQSAIDQVRAQIPQGWECKGLPVWTLPAQLPLLRQMLASGGLPQGVASPAAAAPPPDLIPHTETIVVAGSRSHEGVARASEVEVDDLLTEVLPALAPGGPGSLEWAAQAGAAVSPGANGTRSVAAVAPTVAPASVGSAEPPTPVLQLTGRDNSPSYRVDEAGATIGRAASSSIHLVDDRVSGRHARIYWRDGAYWLADLGSTNGTAVNNQRLTQPVPLAEGDVVMIGRSSLLAHIERTSN